MSEPPDQTELLRELIENLDAFREATTETFKVLHKQQQAFKKVLGVLTNRVWFLFGAVVCVVILFLIMALLSLRQ